MFSCTCSSAIPITQSTLANFVIPVDFNFSGTPCPIEEMSHKATMQSIKSANTDFLSRSPAVYTPQLLKMTHITMAMYKQGISAFTDVLIKTHARAGKSLDVGCGIGLDSIALFKRNWSVDVLDIHQELLDIFKKNVSHEEISEEKKSMSEEKKYRIINADLSKASLREDEYDLVMAYDVLSYLPPESLMPTIKKIYNALMPGGLFAGTLLVNREIKNEDDNKKMAEIHLIKAYSYTNPALVANILKHAGFQVEVSTLLEIFPDPTHPASLVYFVARKAIRT